MVKTSKQQKMSKEKRLHFTIYTMPLDRLRLGTRAKGSTSSSFGDSHVYSYVEDDLGNFMDYEIELPFMKSSSLVYYVDEEQKNLMNPSFYLRPQTQPRWSERDAKTGKVSKQTTAGGDALEKFMEDYKEAFERECRKMAEQDRVFLMGVGFAKLKETTDLIKPIVDFSLYPKDHPRTPGYPNEEKSKNFKIALWVQDKTKHEAGESKKKFKFAPKPGTTPVKEEEETILVPDTNQLIFTHIYDNVPISAAEQRRRNNNLRATSSPSIKGKRAHKYDPEIKKFTYNSGGHHNAMKRDSELFSQATILAPSLRFVPKDNKVGEVMIKMREWIVKGCNSRSFSTELSDERQAKIDEACRLAAEEAGFVQVENNPEFPEIDIPDDYNDQGGGDDSQWQNDDDDEQRRRSFNKVKASNEHGGGDDDGSQWQNEEYEQGRQFKKFKPIVTEEDALVEMDQRNRRFLQTTQ